MKSLGKALVLPVLMLSIAAVPSFSQTDAPPPPPVPRPTPVTPPTVPTVSPPVMTPPALTEPTAGPPAKTDGKPAGKPNGKQAGKTDGKPTGDSLSLLSLLGLGSDSTLLQALNPGSSGDGDMSGLLEKALKRIETDRGSQDTASGSMKRPVAPTQDAPSAPASRAQAPASAEPSILRFLVNGYDLLQTFGGPLIASRSGDGSFLITGDRFLILSGRRRRETFYLLYRKETASRGRLYMDVSQEVANGESYLFRLSRRGPFGAERIGDLLVVRDPAEDLSLDLVFRLPVATGSETSGR